ncbi:MAG: hypothetical protein ACFCU8_03180 [Thermosynechococcaceae cyanobacterium]
MALRPQYEPLPHSGRSGSAPHPSALRLLIHPLLWLQEEPAFWDCYLHAGLEQIGPSSYSAPQMMRGLTWLARICDRFLLSEIRVAHLQPTWLEPLAQRRYRWWVSLCGGSYFGLVVGLTGGLSFGLAGDLRQGISSGVLSGLVGGFISGAGIGLVSHQGLGLSFGPLGSLNEIRPLPVFRWSWRYFYRNLRRKLIRRLLWGLLLGIFLGLGKEPLNLVLFASLGTTIFGVLEQLYGDQITDQTALSVSWRVPIEIALLTATLCGVCLYGLLLLAFDQSIPWLQLPLMGLPLGLYFGFFSGGFIQMQRLILRGILWQAGVLPWDIGRFLEDAISLGMLQRQGDRYCFIHPALQAHLIRLGRLTRNDKTET